MLRFVVQVIAIDEDETSFRSTATVTINIKDTNDNSPEFPQDSYKLNVAEHSPAGTVIAKITVSALLSELLLRQFELACEKLCCTQWRTRCLHVVFFFPRQRTLTQWIKATSPTNSFQKACVSTLEPNCTYSGYLNAVHTTEQSVSVFQIAVF